jgi:hypothetical protein
MFSVLATLNEQKWSTLGERRGRCEDDQAEKEVYREIWAA